LKPTVFISHISEEAEVAIWMKGSISKLLLGNVQFFVSSDRAAIIGGDRWLNKIEDALRDAPIVLVLCSPRSVQRPWVNFEAGGAWIAGKRVVPVCHVGMRPADLPEPLRSLQAYDLLQGQDFQDMVALLAGKAGLNKPDFDSATILSEIPPIAKIPQTAPTSVALAAEASSSEAPDSLADIKVGYENRVTRPELHRYSLTFSVTWRAPRGQDFFNITLMWPKDVRISKLVDFERGEEEEQDGIIYEELSLFVDKRLWPQKTIKAIGGKAAAQLEYDFDDTTHLKVHSNLRPAPYKLHYKLYSQEWPPLEGEVSFKELNNY
jgi:hypothetical protein